MLVIMGRYAKRGGRRLSKAETLIKWLLPSEPLPVASPSQQVVHVGHDPRSIYPPQQLHRALSLLGEMKIANDS